MTFKLLKSVENNEFEDYSVKEYSNHCVYDLHFRTLYLDTLMSSQLDTPQYSFGEKGKH